MTAIEREYLTGYFHDSILADWHYDQTEHSLTLSLQCDWEAAKNGGNIADRRFTYRVIFEDVLRFICDTAARSPGVPLFWFYDGRFADTDEPDTLHYIMRLSEGTAEVICRDIRVERARGELLPPKRNEKGYYTYEL